jgi:hypothetical protein
MATVQPSRNPMLNTAWKAHKAAQRAEKKEPKEEATAPVVAKTRASKQVVAKKPAKARRK